MKTIYRKFFLAALFAVFFFISSNGKALEKNDLLPYTDSLTGWVYLLENEIYLTFEEFLDNYNEILGLPEQHNFTYSLHPSPYNEEVTYVKLFQTFNDFEVERSRITLHLRNNYVEIITGAFIENLPLLDNRRTRSFQIVLDEDIALANALNALNIDPAIFDENNTLMYSGSTNLEEGEESTSNIKPQGHLKYARKTDSETANNEYVLAWEFLISQADTSFERVLVNATNGLIEEISDARQFGTYQKGGVQTLYNGYRAYDMECFKCDFCVNWKLENSRNIETFLRDGSPKNSENIWYEESEAPATSAHWAIGKIREFFDGLQWLGTFDNNFKLKVNTGFLEDAAYCIKASGRKSAEIHVGYYYNTVYQKPFALSTIDIIGHEYGHLVIHKTSDLLPSGESGALAEGFANIFGVMAQHKIANEIDYYIGERTGKARASMYKPMYYKDASTGWQPSTNSEDNYGVHTNCGVLHSWFYRLASSVNPSNAGDIAYGTNLLLNPSDGYAQAKAASIVFAKELGGHCSTLHKETTKAWNDLGIGLNQTPFCGFQPPILFAPAPSPKEPSADVEFSRSLASSILVYPNPVKDILHVQIPDCMLGGSIILTSMDGKEILSKPIEGTNLKLDFQSLKSGVYFVRIIDGENQYYHKIIK